MKGTLFPAAMALVGMMVPAWADGACIANMGRFELGQYACLQAGETSHLARCETNLNILSWKQVLDHCPGGPAPGPALATSVCRANGQLFPAGGFACLVVAGSTHLARCDTVLNDPSWTKVQEGCPGPPPPEVLPERQVHPWLKQPLAGPRRLIERLRNAL
ncbi:MULTISPECIES: hypothetical protein [unclassified Mesorhizobium]|uniref:hypothetical protein n=1 Tax=unclassified Mesorhizobium TaxID=325217 RepID=UPI001FE1E54B|nr:MULTISPECIES: hypothetical protein [unclassified Mesorhizobium]